MIKDTKSEDINVKDNDGSYLSDSSLHSEAIKENLDNVNMEPWYYIYENYVNLSLKKKMD